MKSSTTASSPNGAMVASPLSQQQHGGLHSQPETPTDAIIEELKSLAKSMLDATNAARRKAHAQEGRRSYEALLTAIESRHLPAATGASSITAYGSDNSRAPRARVSVSTDDGKNDVKNTQSKSTSVLAEEDLTDIPAVLSPQFMNQSDDSTRVATPVVENSTPIAAAKGAVAETGRKAPTAAVSSAAVVPRHRDPAPLDDTPHTYKSPGGHAVAAGEEEDDSNIFEGVMTQMFFMSTDVKAFNDVRGSTWKPESGKRMVMLQHSDGDSESANATNERAERDSDGYDDKAPRRESSRRRSISQKSQDPGKPNQVRVLRVPSFPFGGGITESQARRLQARFHRCIRHTPSNSAEEPEFISKAQFDSYGYAEVATTAEERRQFNPTSPFEFVVELERRVVFDAARAREERRQEFKRLVHEGRAPATMGTFNLRIIMDPVKTGFEEERNFPIVRGNIVAGRYQIIQLLGKATFSRAVRCHDLHQPYYDDDDDGGEGDDAAGEDSDGKGKRERTPSGYAEVCLKIINNSKDFFDQSLDEIRLLTLVNKYKDADEAHVIRLIDAFYYKEHTMLVTELLCENLYEYSKYNREEEKEFYFTIPRLRRIARQIAEALSYVHSLNLIHADLKPENILFVSHRRCLVKVIDFGSSCYLSDHLSSYIQSRSYRAPEVVLGCDYDGRIDVWSLGAILAELATGNVLFISETVPEMLARIVHVCGTPFPRHMLWEGRHTYNFFNKFGCIYERGGKEGEEETDDDPYYVYTPVSAPSASSSPTSGTKAGSPTAGESAQSNETPYHVLHEKLEAAGFTDALFFSFIEACLTLDHKKRPTSEELLQHPFIADEVV